MPALSFIIIFFIKKEKKKEKRKKGRMTWWELSCAIHYTVLCVEYLLHASASTCVRACVCYCVSQCESPAGGGGMVFGDADCAAQKGLPAHGFPMPEDFKFFKNGPKF